MNNNDKRTLSHGFGMAVLAASVGAALAGCGNKPEAAAPQAQAASPATAAADEVPENPLKDAYFGEQHVHTGVSMDAFIGGNRLTPDDAYRFAKGEEIMVNGSMHRIKRPLDWVAVTDHAEFMGEAYSLMTPGTPRL